MRPLLPEALTVEASAAGDAAPGRRLGRLAWQHRAVVSRLAVCAMAMAVISAALPVALAQGLDLGLSGSSGQVAALVAVVVATGVVVWALNRWRAYLTRVLVADVVLDLRLAALDGALRQDLDYYDRHSMSAAADRATHDLDQFDRNAFSLLELLQQLLVILVLLPLMLAVDWRLTVLVVLVGLVIVLATRSVRSLAQRASADAASAFESLGGTVREMLHGLTTLRAFGAEAVLTARAFERNDAGCARAARADAASAALQPVLSLVIGAAIAALVLAGGLLQRTGVLTVASWYLFILAADRISWLLSSSGSLVSQWQAVRTTSERVFELADSRPEPATGPRVCFETDPARTYPALRPGSTSPRGHDVAVDNVSLRYASGVEALRRLTLHVPAGTHLGLVGRSGAGKSSLLKALARLHPIAAGEIRLGGTPLGAVPEADLRRTVAYVPQRPQLFAGTLADNLRLVRPDATDAELTEVITEAGLAPWLADLPAGLETEVGPAGNRLSLGQRQLVGLLRGLVKRPGLVLLDEPLANVDADSERYLHPAMRSLLGGTTCIVIAHRLSTVRTLDAIAVMRQGRVVEVGTHDELLAQHGDYATLHRGYLEASAP